MTPVRYRSFMADSRRWDRFVPRDGDVVISAAPKSGMTWMQMLCAVTIFGPAELPAPLSALSPWLDLQTTDIDALVATLEAQHHRRFIKTHTPLDGLPIHPGVTYLCVARDPRDVVISWHHHLGNVRARTLLAAVASVAPGELAELAAGAERREPDLAATVDRWLRDDREPSEVMSSLRSTTHHAATFWEARSEGDVHLFHYEDLEDDIEGTLARLARLLGVAGPPSFAELATAASLPAMRARADLLAPDAADGLLEDNAAFFRAGGTGQWRDVLSGAHLELYRQRCLELVAGDLSRWLHRN